MMCVLKGSVMSITRTCTTLFLILSYHDYSSNAFLLPSKLTATSSGSFLSSLRIARTPDKGSTGIHTGIHLDMSTKEEIPEIPEISLPQNLNSTFKSSIFLEDLESFYHKKEERKSTKDVHHRNQTDTQSDSSKIHSNPKYNWSHQWYPIHAVDTIDKTKPLKTYLLGKELVIWYSESEDTWNVFEDACPHRQGPLSEGRIEGSNLLCSYHGWKFDSEGSCSHLPYSKNELRERHEGSCRAKCESFPTTVEHGLLFVFPESGPDAKLLAALTPMTGIRELVSTERKEGDDMTNVSTDMSSSSASASASSSSWRYKIPAGVRDFPCGWDTMVENTLDPAHFCAAHHGTLGNRYTDPKHYSQKVIQPLSKNTTSNDPFIIKGDFGTLEFQPPCLVRYTPDNPSMPFGGKMTIATYCVPTRPGWVRPLATVVMKERPSFWWMQERVQLSEFVLEIFMNPLTPVWLGHTLSSIVLHQDAGILYYQHRNFRRKGYLSQDKGSEQYQLQDKKKSYHELAYMPNEADKAVAMFRQWLQKSSHGADVTFDPRYRDDPTESIDIFDMWNAHTSQCKNCSDAYRRLEIMRKVAWGVFYGSILASPVLATTTTTDMNIPIAISPWMTLVLGIASASTGMALDRFNGLFRRYEVRHTDDSIIDKLPFL
jgi:phenylpropionate dioxygenase-like ring-hydroxylating dioxygenase large terminal subunit